MKENVYLVDLGTGTDRSLLPLACGLISSYCHTVPEIKDNYNIQIRMLGQGLDELMDELVDPVVVGFSCYVWNFFGSVEISRRLKEKYPDVLVVWGGPSIPAKERRIGQFFREYPFVDILVHLEGEITFADILLKRLHKEPLSECLGISYRSKSMSLLHDGFNTNVFRDRIKDFSVVPSPFLNGIFDKLLDRYGDHIVGALWETSRGCPFKCFHENTRIITSRCPNQKAKDIKVGDFLMCIDEKTREIRETEVKQVFSRTAQNLLKITFEDNSCIKVTDEHPFYLNEKWVEAKNLQVNDEIFHITYLDKISFNKKVANPAKRPEVRAKISKTVTKLFKNGFKTRLFEKGFQKKHRCRDKNVLDAFYKRHSERMKNNNPMKRKDVQEKQTKTLLGHIADGSVIPYMCTPQYWEKLKNSPNKLEIKFLKMLKDEFGDRYKFTGDGSSRIGYYAPDYLDESNHKIIELNGCYWHNCQQCFSDTEPSKRDKDRISKFEDAGYKAAVVWSHELKDEDKLFKRLRNFTHNRKKITKIEKLKGCYRVVNFSCYPYENYFAEYILSHNCSFCDWGNAVVNKVNRLELNRVLKEVEWVADKNLHYVYATDANFGITVKRDLEIAEGFVDVFKRRGTPDTLILNWTKNSSKSIVTIAEALWAGGVTTNVTLSYQSFHQPTLDAIERTNIKPAYLDELKKEFHSKGVPTYNELILGLPEETLETFVSGIDKACSPHIKDQLSIYLCVILENTGLMESMEKYGIETRQCAVGLNRRKFKYPRFGEDQIVVETNTMPQKDWEKAYEVAFAFTCFYNLRVAYFIILWLKYVQKAKVTDFIKFLLSSEYPSISRVTKHLKATKQSILDSISSVKAVEGGDGVALTPHEAMTFLLLNDMDQTYTDLRDAVCGFCAKYGYSVDMNILDEIIQYQKARIPVFDYPQLKYRFKTNIPYFFQELTESCRLVDIQEDDMEIEIIPLKHPYKTETEYNLRRVACGYTLNLAGADISISGRSKCKSYGRVWEK